MLQAIQGKKDAPIALVLPPNRWGAVSSRQGLKLGNQACSFAVAHCVRCHSSRGAGNKRAPPLLQKWSRENNVAGAVRLLAAIAKLPDDVQQLMILGLKLARTPDGEVVGILLHFADGSVEHL
jgi:hypothetical protein